jgi:cytochrome c556
MFATSGWTGDRSEPGQAVCPKHSSQEGSEQKQRRAPLEMLPGDFKMTPGATGASPSDRASGTCRASQPNHEPARLGITAEQEYGMYRRFWVSFAGVLLALALCLLMVTGGQSADDEEQQAIQQAQQAVLKLMDAMGKGGDGKAQAAAIHAKFKDDLKIVMTVFKPRDKGGIGVGSKARGDGIELKIISLGKRAPAKGDLSRLQPDLELIARVSKAMAEVADQYPQTKNQDMWKKFDDEMRKGADELMEAARSGDPKAVKTAANNLNASCTNCHSTFRDN